MALYSARQYGSKAQSLPLHAGSDQPSCAPPGWPDAVNVTVALPLADPADAVTVAVPAAAELVSVEVATPLALVVLDATTVPREVVHVTVWPAMALPLASLTVAVKALVLLPSAGIDVGLAVTTMLAGAPTTGVNVTDVTLLMPAEPRTVAVVGVVELVSVDVAMPFASVTPPPPTVPAFVVHVTNTPGTGLS